MTDKKAAGILTDFITSTKDALKQIEDSAGLDSEMYKETVALIEACESGVRALLGNAKVLQ